MSAEQWLQPQVSRFLTAEERARIAEAQRYQQELMEEGYDPLRSLPEYLKEEN